MTPQARLLEILTLLSLTPKEDRNVGICHWVQSRMREGFRPLTEADAEAIEYMQALMRRWPEGVKHRYKRFSYIVPAERGNTNLQDAVYAYNNLPRWTKGPHAEMRCELLQWMIKELTNA